MRLCEDSVPAAHKRAHHDAPPAKTCSRWRGGLTAPGRPMPANVHPRSLDAKALEKNIKKSKSEFKKMTSEVDAELARVMERLAEKKAWSRLEEVKQQESELTTAKAEASHQAEASRRAAEARERAAVLRGQRSPMQTAGGAPECSEEEMRLREELARANVLAERAHAKKAASEAKEAEAPTSAQGTKPTPGLLEAGASLFGSFFGVWGGSDAIPMAPAAPIAPVALVAPLPAATVTPEAHDDDVLATGEVYTEVADVARPQPAVTTTTLLDAAAAPVASASEAMPTSPTVPSSSTVGGTLEQPAEFSAEEQALREMRQQCKAAQRHVDTLRATGGAALQDAVAVLNEIKPKYRAAAAAWNAKQKNEKASGEPWGKEKQRPDRVAGSKASQLSARRLERHGARMDAKMGGVGAKLGGSGTMAANAARMAVKANFNALPRGHPAAKHHQMQQLANAKAQF